MPVKLAAFRSGVPGVHPLDQVATGQNLQRRLPDGPARDEGAGRAVRMDGTQGVAQFMVGQQGERAVAVVVGAQSIGDAGQP